MLARFVALALAVLVLGMTGCVYDSTPQLIQVLDYAPHEAEVGDRIELMGAGFPQGRPAHLLFRGTLHRPGEKPTTGVEIAAEGSVTSPQHIELAFTDALEAVFCGAGDHALHTTFDGEVDVAFSVASPKDPPIAGTLRRVSIDFRPAEARAEIASAREAEGARALAFMGIHAKDDAAPSGGVVVATVDAPSRADEAGISPGDTLTVFDGVRLVSVADVVPAPGASSVTIALRRGQDPREQARTINVEGYRPAPPTDLLAAAILLAVVAAVVLLFVAPTPGRLGWLERKLSARIQETTRARHGASGAKRATRTVKALVLLGFLRGLIARGASPFGSYAVFAVATTMFLFLPFAQPMFGAEADAGVLFLLVFTAFVLVAVVTGGWAARERWTVKRGAVAALTAVSVELPAAIAVFAVVVTNGTLRIPELVRAQGGAPWDWYALKSPAALALFALSFGTMLIDDEPRAGELVEADLGPPLTEKHASPRASFFALAEQAKTFVLAGLIAALFLGGWGLPGVSPAEAGSQRSLAVLGAALFAVKAWALVLGVAWARWALPRVPAARMTKLVWKWLAPGALAALAGAVGWLTWSPDRAAQRVISMALTATLALLAGQVVHRLYFTLRAAPARRARVALNPFL